MLKSTKTLSMALDMNGGVPISNRDMLYPQSCVRKADIIHGARKTDPICFYNWIVDENKYCARTVRVFDCRQINIESPQPNV